MRGHLRLKLVRGSRAITTAFAHDSFGHCSGGDYMSNDAGMAFYTFEWPLLSAVCTSRSMCTVHPQEVFYSHMNKIKQRRSEQKALYKAQRQVSVLVFARVERERESGVGRAARTERVAGTGLASGLVTCGSGAASEGGLSHMYLECECLEALEAQEPLPFGEPGASPDRSGSDDLQVGAPGAYYGQSSKIRSVVAFPWSPRVQRCPQTGAATPSPRLDTSQSRMPLFRVSVYGQGLLCLLDASPESSRPSPESSPSLNGAPQP